MAKKTKKKGKLVRGRQSTSGKISLPAHVRSNKDLPKLLKVFKDAMKKNTIVFVLIHADGCHHCHEIMPHFNSAMSNSNNTINGVTIENDILDGANKYIKRNINPKAEFTNVSAFPTAFIVTNKGTIIKEVDPLNKESLISITQNAGPLAKEINLNNISEYIPNANYNANYNSKSNLSKSNRSKSNRSKSNRSKSNRKVSFRKTPYPISEPTLEGINGVNESNESKESKEANEVNESKEANIFNLQAPISPISQDLELIVPPSKTPNGLAVQSKKGGSLMSAMIKASQTLAPTAALITMADMKFKKSKKKLTFKKK